MSDTITNTTNTNESKVFNVYVSKSTTAGTALVTIGSLNKTDTAPTVSGLYILEETGIYPNLGNIDAKAGKLNFASFDGTTWSLVTVEIDYPINEIITENNILENPSFNSGFTGWTANDSFSTPVNNGILSINASANSNPAIYQIRDLKAGKYKALARVKNNSGIAGNIKVTLSGMGGVTKDIPIQNTADFQIINVDLELSADISGSLILLLLNDIKIIDVDYFYFIYTDDNAFYNLIAPINEIINLKSISKAEINISGNNIVVSKAGMDIIIDVQSQNFIFDSFGGLRKLSVQNVTIPNTNAVYLSKSATEFIPVDFDKKGNAEEVYLFACRFDYFLNGGIGKYTVGINYNGWSPIYPVFQLQSTSGEIGFSSINYKVIRRPLYVRISNATQEFVFDTLGGIRIIPPQSIDINDAEVLYLSKSATEFIEVDFNVKGNAENVYFWKERFDAPRSYKRKNIIGVFYGNWETQYNTFEIQQVDTDKPWMPRKNSIKSPFYNDLKPFFDKMQMRTQDVTLVQIGDSISTDLNFTDKRPDANERPPFCTEYNLNSYLEEKLRWKEQKYRRFDYDGVFTDILGGGAASVIDESADWFLTGASFLFPITKLISGGTNAGVSFKMPSGIRRLSLILHSDAFFATSTQVTIAGGNGKVEVFNGTSWVEANGYSTSFKETVPIAPGNIVRDNPQKRLKFRSLTDLTEKTISVQNVGTGRFGYWGIEYSPKEFMFTYVCSSKGSHGIDALRLYEEWMVDAYNPDLVLFQCCILNEKMGQATRVKTPTDFANYFKVYYEALEAKGYLIFPYIVWAATYSHFIDTSGNFLSGVNTTTGNPQTCFDDINYLTKMYEDKGAPILNLFSRFTEIGLEKSDLEGSNLYDSALVGSGKNGETFLTDGVHLNKVGNEILFRLLEPYLNY